MSDLRKTVIVTGGSSGIGKAIVERFAAAGHQVAFAGRTPSRISETLKDVEAKTGNGRILGHALDLKEKNEIDSFFDKVETTFGNIGVLINNAAISPKESGMKIPTHKLAQSQFDEVIATNLAAPLYCVQRVLPGMMSANFGRIIMIGSLAARTVPTLAGSAYVASKAGLAGLARSLVGEYASYGITTNVVSPGNVATNMTGGDGSATMQAAVSRIPAGRVGLPEDFPGLIAFLCSEEASFINGATIDVTGGEYVPA